MGNTGFARTHASLGRAASRRARWRNLAFAFLTTTLVIALNPLAQAQLTEPPDTSDPPRSVVDDLLNTPQENPDLVPDTDATPIAEEESKEWTQFHGALFPKRGSSDPTQLVTGSATTYADNLYDVDFAHSDLGLAGGASCEAPDPDAESGCKPTAFVFTRTEVRGAAWDRAELPNEGDRPGFVGAIAWLDNRTAMAVGGTGTLPRREPPYGKTIDGADCPEPEYGEPWQWNCDQAGEARAWLYRHGAGWCELGQDDGCPPLPAGRDGEAAHGLTAVDFREDPATGQILGFAAGLGQIFRWQGGSGSDGGWDKLYDNESARNELDQGIGDPQTPASSSTKHYFNFRVRDLRFAPYALPRAYAVTSGCCSPHEGADNPALLTYSDRQGTTPVSPRWFLWRGQTAYGSGGRTEGNALPVQGADHNESITRANELAGTIGLEEPVPRPPATKASTSAGRLESFYSLTVGPSPGGVVVPPATVLNTTAAVDQAVEPTSQVHTCAVYGTAGAGASPGARLFAASLSTARLLSLDGAVTHAKDASQPASSTSTCRAHPEWAVGELRSTEVQGHGRGGLVVQTKTRTEQIQAHNVSAGPEIRPTPEEATQGWEPTSEEQVRTAVGTLESLTTSYTLNSLDLLGDSGSGWAVGDHGAILRIGGSQSRPSVGLGAEPVPPRLGARRTARVTNTDAYPDRAPASNREAVPSLAEQPTENLDEPRLVNTGSPDASHAPPSREEIEDVAEIVISRDGSEGWAVGSNPPMNPDTGGWYGTTSLYHYDGTAWSRCDPSGARGQLAPDPACASLARLRSFPDPAGAPASVKLVSLARVPLENDADPQNDDEFEVVAVGTGYRGDPRHGRNGAPVILRYGDGRWDFESPSARDVVKSRYGADDPSAPDDPDRSFNLMRPTDVAFTAPDDGWILARDSRGSPGWTELFHYGLDENGELRWERCPLAGSPGAEASDSCGSERIPPRSQPSTSPRPRLVSAGGRVYLFGERVAATEGQNDSLGDGANRAATRVPYILYHEAGTDGWTDGSDTGEGGGLDPGWQNPSPGVSGRIYSLAMTQAPDGTYSGWAQGRFFDHDLHDASLGGEEGSGAVLPTASLFMRLEPGARSWEPFHDPGAAADYLAPQTINTSLNTQSEPELGLVMSGADGSEQAFFAQREHGRLFGFEPVRARWDLVRSERVPSLNAAGAETVDGDYQALAPDNQGGFWAAVSNENKVNDGFAGTPQVFFYHYTSAPPRPVFSEAPQPFGERNVRITSLAGAPDGSLWATTSSSLLAHYERATGWQTVEVPGWQPGRVVTRGAPANAVAVGPDGSGVAVGEGGRIASLSTDRVVLDAAASVLCGAGGLGPGCGTSRDLNAAALAPDGSALVGGDAMALLWRSGADEAFQRIPSPLAGGNADITGISMPSATQAWITTTTGYVLAGESTGSGDWVWRTENKVFSGADAGTMLGAIDRETNLPLRSVAIAPEGGGYAGYAVGDRGLVLERTGDPEQPWRRLRAPGTDNLTAVALAQGAGAEQALLGGEHGVVWTAEGAQLEIARPADYFPGTHAPLTGPVVGAALLPGVSDGQTEAWIALQARGEKTNQLLHYTNAPEEPLLDPARGASALPDAPPERDGELRIAAFGKSDCDGFSPCPAHLGTREVSDAVLDRITAETVEDGVDLALHTGDAVDSAGVTGASAAGLDETGDPILGTVGGFDAAGLSGNPKTWGARKHRRFADFVTQPLADAGVPTLGALGSGDLSRPAYNCAPGGGCRPVAEQARAGDNLAWRAGLAEQAAPWGMGDELGSASGVELTGAAGADDQAQELPEESIDADGDESIVRPVEVKNGARTHYAADVVRDDEQVARIVVVDSSLRGLSTADGVQNPIERDSQLGFLERMLCFRGQAPPSGGECTREPDQAAIVLSNTPTYSYGPIDPTALASDGTVLESLYLRYRVSAVISGRLGWNGLYYALRPGLHTPCPGDAYPEHPPEPGTSLCESVASQLPASPAGNPEATLAESTGTSVAEILDTAQGGEGVVPFVVASGAGGKFGPDGSADGSASEGFWHGYSLVRVPASGDPRGVIVEQRPILDWVSIGASEREVAPRQRLRLEGLGREPIGYSWQQKASTTRYDEISSQAITHRYDLLLADPEEPWLACREDEPACSKLQRGLSGGEPVATGDCAPYLCLPERVGTVDRTTGQVRGGDGRYPDTYALAMLSVGEQVATYPLVFKRSPSFVVNSNLRVPGAPATSNPPTPKPPGQPPLPDVPQIPKIEIPTPPAPPAIPSLTAAAPPELQPPAPPAPPPPSQQPAPLDLSVAPPGVSISTPTALIQPPTPPVNPAPPGGARREARQRQAAAQKGGADSGAEESDSASGTGVDLAQGPSKPEGAAASRHESAYTRYRPPPGELAHRRHESAFRRREHVGHGASFTTLTRAEQPSTWSQGALYGAGIALAAAVLAAGFSTLRPTPRRREPELPAPARSTARH